MLLALNETRKDLIAGVGRWELWTLLAWNEIRQKYRRSSVGPLWASLNFAFFVGLLGFLYSELFGRELKTYMPHLILGMLVWNFVSQVALEGCHLFKNMRSYILEINVPLTVFLYVLVWKNVILFAFSLLIFFIAIAFLSVDLSLNSLNSILGLILILINSLWIGLFVAVTSARYHDLIEVIGSVFRILFFLTPIIWVPGMEGRLNIVLDVNPFYHFIEVFRAPLMGNEVSLITWIVNIVLAIVGWVITALLYTKYKKRIAFWL